MSEAAPLLDRAAIQDAFRRLGERLARRGVVADIYVIGGAAMTLAYDARRSTRDIDAVFQPHGVVLEEAWAVADELGLPRWWLNEQASSYAARGGDQNAPHVFDHPGLRVSAASPEHLLAIARRYPAVAIRASLANRAAPAADQFLAFPAILPPPAPRQRGGMPGAVTSSIASNPAGQRSLRLGA